MLEILRDLSTMAFDARCPSCGLDYSLADTVRGKSVRCKQCREVFVAGGPQGQAPPDTRIAVEETNLPSVLPVEDGDGPRRRPRYDEAQGLDRPRSPREPAPGGSAGWVVGGVLGTVALL